MEARLNREGKWGRQLAVSCVVLLTATAATPVKWYRYDKSTLIQQDFNDGDSFHVRCGRRHYIFRLYFVDAPETDSSFPKRVQAQADYWKTTPERVITLGEEAKRFTREYLAKPFTVHTRRVDARGRSDRKRFFAMIETEQGYLSEALVRNGLARIHGMPTELPDGRKAARHFGRLRLTEKTARKDERGGWDKTPPTVVHQPEVKAQDYTLRARLSVFDPARPTRLLGFLQRGAVIRVLKAETKERLRIRFKVGGREREGLCRRDSIDLGTN